MGKWTAKEAETMFREIFPDFFDLANIRTMSEEETYAELIRSLDDYTCPEQEPACEVTFALYHGNMEVLRKAVALVDEEWPAFFHEDDEIFVGMADGEIASFCLLDKFGEHELGGRKVKVAGPGCVGTVPKFRKRRIASKMVLEATEILKERGYDYSYIHYTAHEVWYQLLGFQMFVRWDKYGVLDQQRMEKR